MDQLSQLSPSDPVLLDVHVSKAHFVFLRRSNSSASLTKSEIDHYKDILKGSMRDLSRQNFDTVTTSDSLRLQVCQASQGKAIQFNYFPSKSAYLKSSTNLQDPEVDEKRHCESNLQDSEGDRNSYFVLHVWPDTRISSRGAWYAAGDTALPVSSRFTVSDEILDELVLRHQKVVARLKADRGLSEISNNTSNRELLRDSCKQDLGLLEGRRIWVEYQPSIKAAKRSLHMGWAALQDGMSSAREVSSSEIGGMRDDEV